jgi:hypothetical protein
MAGNEPMRPCISAACRRPLSSISTPARTTQLHKVCVALHDYCLEDFTSLGLIVVGRGRVKEARMGTLVFVCPATGEEVSTGIEMDTPTLNQLHLSKIYCPQCRQPHQMFGTEYWLSRIELPTEEAA